MPLELDSIQKDALTRAKNAGDVQQFNAILHHAANPQPGAGPLPNGGVEPLKVRLHNAEMAAVGLPARFADTLANFATAGISGTALKHLVAGIKDESPDAAAQQIQSFFDDVHASSPTADTVARVGGAVAGLVGGVKGLGKLGEMADKVPALRPFLPKAGEGLLKTGVRMAVPGAAAGAIPAAVNSGGDLPSTLVGGAAGALAGPVVGGLGGAAVKGAGRVGDAVGDLISRYAKNEGAGLSRGTARKVGHALALDPAEIAATEQRSAQQAGRHAMVDVLGPAQQQQAAALLERNPQSFNAAKADFAQHEAGLGPAVSSSIRQAQGQTALPLALRGLRTPELTPNAVGQKLNAWADNEFAQFRNVSVSIPATVMDDATLVKVAARMPKVRDAMHAAVGVNAQLAGAGGNVKLTGAEVDDLRQALNKLSKHPGDEAADARNLLMSEVASSNPQYQAILKNYGEAAQWEAGFNKGWKGTSQGEIGRSSPDFRNVNTAPGQAGVKVGLLSGAQNTAQESPAAARKVAQTLTAPSRTGRAARAAVGKKAAGLEKRLTTLMNNDKARQAANPNNVKLSTANRKGLSRLVEGAIRLGLGMPRSAGAQGAGAVVEALGAANLSPAAQAVLAKHLFSKQPEIRQAALRAYANATTPDKATDLAHAVGAVFGGGVAGNLVTQGTGQ